MTILFLLFFAGLFLAYSNGANDNFKGVATLFGSDTTNYKTAIRWATITTFAGSVSSVLFAHTLVKTFSGKGMVPDALTANPEFLLAVGFGAALTVILATVTGFPISTTHSLTGALVGAGFVSVGPELQVSVLQNKFVLPLILSPLLAMTLSGTSYLIFRYGRRKLGLDEESFLYVNQAPSPEPKPLPAYPTSVLRTRDARQESRRPGGNLSGQGASTFFGIPLSVLLDKAHFLSAGLVSFARGLNDTPKIAALLLVVNALSLKWGFSVVGLAMAIGGLLNARKVAHTMSKRITAMNHGQGFTANLVTGFLVIFASRLGVPVSTTHVSVGALSGIGLITRQANRGVLTSVFLSWVLTLPIAAVLSGGIYLLAGA